jgi:hypothetical protein
MKYREIIDIYDTWDKYIIYLYSQDYYSLTFQEQRIIPPF